MTDVSNNAVFGTRWINTCLCALLCVLAVGLTGFTYPKPAAVPYRWQFEIKPGPLRLYIDRDSQDAFWYFTYQVVNRTGRDRIWAPEFTLFTDDGSIVRSGVDVPPYVEDRLRALVGNDLLKTQNEIIGDLLEGRENAEDGLVVWRAYALDVNEISMFVAGLSGETATLTNQITGDTVVLRKTLQRNYLVPGDAAARRSAPAPFVEERWVLR